MYYDDKETEWMTVVAFEERETIKKNYNFNEIMCKIDNLMWDVSEK